MENKYRIINDCLYKLKQSSMPPIERLRIELLLIQMKSLLLKDGVDAEARCKLLSEMRRICRSSHFEGEERAELRERFKEVLDMLESL